MLIKSLGIPALGLALLVAGCSQGESADNANTDSNAAQPQKEATAWWKTEGQAASTTAAADSGTAKPGWAKLAAVDAAAATKGKALFDSKGCVSCHSIGKGQVVGPDLKGLTHRVEPEWLATWLKDPTPVLESDQYAKDMLTKYLVKMPNLNLTPEEVTALTEFLRQSDAGGATKQS